MRNIASSQNFTVTLLISQIITKRNDEQDLKLIFAKEGTNVAGRQNKNQTNVKKYIDRKNCMNSFSTVKYILTVL